MSNLNVYLFRDFCLAFVFSNDLVLFTLDRCVLPSVPQPKSGQSVYIFIEETFLSKRSFIKGIKGII